MKALSQGITIILLLGLAGVLTAQDTPAATSSVTALQTLPVGSSQRPAAAHAASAPAAAPVNNTAEPGDTHVRIVRLSQAEGKLGMDRGNGKGFEDVMQNMPVVEGARLKTDDGTAEVEFEDGSTLRMAPDAQVTFSQLVLRQSGVKASTVSVQQGIVYVNLEKSKDNDFSLTVGQAVIHVERSTHLRVDAGSPETFVSVFDGRATISSGGKTTTVGKKETATLYMATPSVIDVAKGVDAGAWDEWDAQQASYHKRYSGENSYAGGGYSYGLSDLNYYGSFINGPCGSMWQPYFVNSAWDPYGSGLWAWYPGAGYSWVSPYPWGWLPYHMGAWAFCNGMGWGWMPGGGGWRGLRNVTPAAEGVALKTLPGKKGATTTAINTARPIRLPRPPATRTSTMVQANQTPLVSSGMEPSGDFVIRNNSAGLGVPRQSMGNLSHFASDVRQYGSARHPIKSAPMGVTGPSGSLSRGSNDSSKSRTRGSGASSSRRGGGSNGSSHGSGSGSRSSSSHGSSHVSSSGSHSSSGGGSHSSGGGGGGGVSHGGGSSPAPSSGGSRSR